MRIKKLITVGIPKYLPKYVISDEEAVMIKQGKQIAVKEDEEITEKFIRLYKDKEFAGIGRYVFSEHKIAPHKVVL